MAAAIPPPLRWYIANYYNESVTDASGAVLGIQATAGNGGKWRPGGPGRPPKNAKDLEGEQVGEEPEAG